ncbi:hypothetical protein [Leucothrix pacifica]|uniref:Uncharacterized protein n=1 Tax=Leucothrix pacifica TaxID=1247513 RepID=A0A317CAQ3_9GAMM|nr:hypothetical protein [Leucothrix pacifica]PWQ94413.1 hypothetical protein DKW60_16725 [Leucothrix pacifica]
MRLATLFSIALVCLFYPFIAYAAGVNFFAKGLMHPIVVPTQLISVFALGLLLGQQGWKHIRIVLPVFLVGIGAALIMTRYQSVSWNPEMILLPVAAVTGLLLTLKSQWHMALTLLTALVVALVIGMDSSVPMIPGLQTRKIYAHLAGTGISIFSLLVFITLISHALRNLVSGIILRVLGAWSAAGAVLVLTLLLANAART